MPSAATSVVGSLRACAVRVPCSTSNLGSGFDCIGLAFDRYLDARFEPGTEPLVVQRLGTLREVTGADIFAPVFRDALAAHGVNDVRGRVVLWSDIPLARGLGSSGAAVVGAIALAAAAASQSLDRALALTMALAIEGHPDNAAPALFGGLVAIARGADGEPRAFPLPLHDAIGFVFAAPGVEVVTQQARAALPQQLSLPETARALGRTAALVHGLASADPDALRTGFTDELHVPHRLPLIPRGEQALAAAYAAGAWGATISGSGSGLIAACPLDRSAAVMQAMHDALARDDRIGGTAFIVHPDRRGVQPRDPAVMRERERSA